MFSVQVVEFGAFGAHSVDRGVALRPMVPPVAATLLAQASQVLMLAVVATGTGFLRCLRCAAGAAVRGLARAVVTAGLAAIARMGG